MATNIEMNILQSTGTYETLYPKTSTSNLEGTLSTSQLPSSIPASNISGTLSTSNIPNLNASKITSGTLGTARIPSLDASKITSGILSTSVGGTGTTSLSNLASNLSSYLNADFVSIYRGETTCTTSFSIILGSMMFMGEKIIWIFLFVKGTSMIVGSNNETSKQIEMSSGESGTFFSAHESGIQFLQISKTETPKLLSTNASGSLYAKTTTGTGTITYVLGKTPAS